MKRLASTLLALAIAAPAGAQGVVTVVSGEHSAAGGYGVDCPDDLVALGGGFDPSDADNVKVSVSQVLESINEFYPWRWSASVFTRSVSPPYEPFRIGAVCARARGVEYVEDEFPFAAGGIASDSVLCPFGTVAISGGSAIGSGNASESSIAALGPYFPFDVLGPRLADQPDGEQGAPTGWRASRVSEGPDGDGSVNALCLAADDVVTVVESDTVNPGQISISHIPCPAGTFAVSGGADAPILDGLRVVSNGPLFVSLPFYLRLFAKGAGTHEPPPAWRVAVRNDAAVARSIKVAAVCMPEAADGSIVAFATLLAARVRRRIGNAA